MKQIRRFFGVLPRALAIALVAVCLISSASAMAQGLPTGTVNGRVSDTAGGGLPGVLVTAKSPSLQGSRTTVTNANGDYSFSSLPPGDYTIAFALSGFGDVVKPAKVGVSQQVTMDTKMAMGGVAASAVVTAQSETVSQSSQTATTYTSEMTNKLPVARTINSAVVLSAGVNSNGPGGNITISGAQSFDNVYTVNGVNIQDNIRGTPTNQVVIEDAIQETTTVVSGVSAEYGRFTGGVINAVTKTGGNAFSGSFRVTLNNDNWQSQTPIEVTRTDTVVPTYEATFGGPLWKDRIWFFGAGRYQKNEASGQTAAPTNVSFPQEVKDTRYEAKLTISPFVNHTLQGSYSKGTVEQTNYAFTGFPLLETNGTTYDRQQPSDLLSINYNGVLSSSFFLEGQYSAKNFTFQNSGSRFNELVKGTAVLIQDRGYGQMFGSIFCAVCPGAGEERNNDEFSAKGTWFLSTKDLGSHNVVFGGGQFNSVRKSNNWQSGSSWLLYASSVRYDGTNLFPVIDDSSYLLYAPIPVISQGSSLKTNSFYVNDTWRLSHFSFNLGVRYDKNDAKDAAGAQTAKDTAWSPRLAASWDVKGDGKLKFTASYATYVGQIQEGIAGSGATAAGSPASYYYYWQGATINGSATGPWLSTDKVLQAMFAAEGVTGLNQFPTRPADTAVVPGVNLLIKDGLSSPKVNEFVLGVGGTLGSNFVYRVDGVRREYKDFYTTQRNIATGKVTDSTGTTFDLGYIVNSNLPQREYTGLHSSVSWRTGALNLAANWTWSHMLGNFIGETSGSGPVTSNFENYPEYFSATWNAPRGSLSQDQTHRVRLVATYDFKLGPVAITPGLVQAWDTGTPYGAAGSVNSRSFVTNPGYVAPPATETYYFTGRDAYRTDDIWRTDLSVNLSGRIGPVEIFVIPQILNLFNNHAVVAPNTSVSVGTGATANSAGLIRFNPFTGTPVECPQSAAAADCKAMGANWKKGVNFGLPTSAASYQIPTRWSVSMGVRF